MATFPILLLAASEIPAQETRYSTSDSGDAIGPCEPVTIPMCLYLPYNSTLFPNLLGHENQAKTNQKNKTLSKKNSTSYAV